MLRRRSLRSGRHTVLLCLVTVLLAVRLAVASLIPLPALESVLQDTNSIDFEDVSNRQLQLSLRGGSTTHYIITARDRLPYRLFASISPCVSELQLSFLKVTEVTSRRKANNRTATETNEAQNSATDHTNRDPEKEAASFNSALLISNSSRTVSLDTSNAKRVILKLRTAADTRFVVKLSPQYSLIELGFVDRYRLQVCRSTSKESQLTVRMSPSPSAHACSYGGCRVCVIVNRIRPMGSYCAAQVGTGNSLPFARPDLLRGFRRLQLPTSDFVVTCIEYSQLQLGAYPRVDITALLLRDPQVLYVNAFVIKEGADSQADAGSWPTLVYQRKHSSTGERLQLASCNLVFSVESKAPLLSRSSGVLESVVAIRTPVNTSLLVRPSRVDLVSSAYAVSVTPYSGMSESFVSDAPKVDCRDWVWAYGGVVCNLTNLHPCSMADTPACNFDSLRLTVRLERKKSSRSGRRLEYKRTERWMNQKHFVSWEFIAAAASAEEALTVKPLMGTVTAAMQHLKNSHPRGNRVQKRNSRRRLSVERACDVAMRQRTVSKAAKRLIRIAAKCYQRLLKLNIRVREDCSSNTHPFVVEVLPADANSRQRVAFIFKVFELQLNNRTRALLQQERYDHAWRLPDSKAYRRILRRVERRLLKTVSSIEEPTVLNQGFALVRRLRHRRRRSGLIASFHSVSVRRVRTLLQRPAFAPAVPPPPTRTASLDHRLFAIYVYSQHAAYGRRPSLFAFTLHSFDRLERFLYRCPHMRLPR